MNDLTQKDSADFDLIHHNASFFSDEQSVPTKGEKYVVFCLGADFFAVPSVKVSEVVQMLSIAPLPNVPEWLLGIADLRGSIISVVSLQKLLGASGAALSPRTKFIALKSENLPASIALAVDRLSEIIFLPVEEIQSVKDENAPYLLGKTAYKINTLSLLNVESLLSALTI